MEVFIKDLKNYVGQSVQLKGWLYNLRSSGKIRFLVLRDGTGQSQCVLTLSDSTKDLFPVVDSLAQESSISVTGIVKEWKGQYEIEATDVQLISLSKDYPISKKEHGVDFLMNHRHLWLRSKRPYHILNIRHLVVSAIHKFFTENHFTLIDPPIFTPSACEGTSTLFSVDTENSDPLYLSQSGQLYLEAASAAFNKVYCLSPTFRAEKSSTRRHLMEFWMCEAEMAFTDINQNMEVIENFVSYIVQYVLKHGKSHLEGLKRDVSSLKKVVPPFPKLHYKEACKKVLEKQPNFKEGEDFGGQDETILGETVDRPLFVHSYPRGIKAFYMKQIKEDACASCDLIAPEGFGEIVGGGQREEDIEVLKNKIKKHNLDQRDFDWYLDIRKYGSFVHSGFGLGIERLVAWICNVPHVREVIPFPRVYGRGFFETKSKNPTSS